MVLVMMGVSGSGKTTAAALLSARLGWRFEEGDALHPPANVEKMHAGHPLTDEDRAPWLRKIADWVAARLAAGENGIITCSALKRAYRDVIRRHGDGVVFVFLTGSHHTIEERLAARKGHYMPATLLDSQIEALEEPEEDEPAIRVDVGPQPAVIVERIMDALGLHADREGGAA